MGNVKKNKWFIAIKPRGKDIFDLSGLKVIEPEKDTYHADPFLFRGLIFFEYYNYEKGVIACMNKSGNSMKIVLKRDYHLSFPFIIEDQGEIYMIPECSRGIEIYRCVDFPEKWEFVEVLMWGSFADTTIFKQGKEFFMFSTEGDNCLRIFRSRSILGTWDLIFAQDIMNSRGAGNIFRLGDKLIRPTQGGEEGYGHKILFKEIKIPYREEIIKEINPDWFPVLTGTHTFNFDETHVVIDGRIRLL